MRSAMRLIPLLACLCVGACNASNSPQDSPKKDATKKGTPAPPIIAPEARAALARMSKTLGQAQGITFFAQSMYDDVQPSGLLLQRTKSMTYTLQRPNGLRVEFAGDGDSRLLVYDGSMATLYDRDKKFYAITSAPDTLEATLDMLAKDADVIIPLSDFLFGNPGKVLLEKVTAATYVGKETIGGVETEHFVFSQAGLDWQLWIATGENAVPRRMVLRYLHVEGSPQYSATMENWNLTADTKPTDFKVTIPADVRQIEFKVDEGGA